MAYKLEISIIDGGDNTIKVVHIFYGVTLAEVETYKREHMASCDYFRSAVKDGRVIEEVEEIEEDELPEVEEVVDDDETA